MNIYDIAKEAGVSIATVSRVINGSSSVSPATRDKILQVIDKYHFSPSAAARGLGLGTMKTIGILCGDISDLYTSEAVAYIEKGLRKYGYHALLICSGYEHERKESALAMLLSRSVDAVILLGSHYVESDDSANDYIRNAAKDIPVFMVDCMLSGENIYCISCDDYDVMYQLTCRLLDSGTRSPIFLYRHESYGTRAKEKAIADACRKYGIDFNDDRSFVCSVGISGCVMCLESVAEDLSFDTVICDNDLLAASTLKYAEAHSLSVPGDLRVTGYDYTILSLTTTPQLTTIDNKIEYVMHSVISALMLRLGGDPVSQKITISANIISGHSI